MGFDYDSQTAALELALDGRWDGVSYHLRELNLQELNNLSDALDQLAALVDAEAIERVHNPKESDMRS